MEEDNMNLSTKVMVLMSEGEAPRDHFLDIVQEDFESGNPFSPTSDIAWSEDDDFVD